MKTVLRVSPEMIGERPSSTSMKVAVAGGLIHTVVNERVGRCAQVWSPAEQVLKRSTSVGILVGPLLNLSGSQSRERQGTMVMWIRGVVDGTDRACWAMMLDSCVMRATRLGCNSLR